jgi:anaphase-promoting complex subunit 8
LEIRRPDQAINAYRNALQINVRDFRAWYGLGQTYELLGLPAFSVYYFHRAASIRPYDLRMWNALGDCYEGLAKNSDALHCFIRAAANGDQYVTVRSSQWSCWRSLLV